MTSLCGLLDRKLSKQMMRPAIVTDTSVCWLRFLVAVFLFRLVCFVENKNRDREVSAKFKPKDTFSDRTDNEKREFQLCILNRGG